MHPMCPVSLSFNSTTELRCTITKLPGPQLTDVYLFFPSVFCYYKSCFSEHGSLHTCPTTSIGQILRSELTVLMVCTFKIRQILSNRFLNKQCMRAPISQPDGTMYLCLRTSPALYHKQLGTFSVKANPTNSLTGSNHYLRLTLTYTHSVIIWELTIFTLLYFT